MDTEAHLKAHFCGAIEHMKTRYASREESFTKMIVDLEAENDRLVAESEALEETVASLRSSLDIRDAEISRLVAALESQAGNSATPLDHLSEAARFGNVMNAHCSILLETQAHQVSELLAAVVDVQAKGLLQNMESMESAERLLLHRLENGAYKSLSDAFLDTTSVRVEARAKFRTICSRAVEAFVNVSATSCLHEKCETVDAENDAWKLLKAAYSDVCCDQFGDNVMCIDGPSSLTELFWECCLEEAQSSMKSISPLSEEDKVLRDVCSVVDLPELARVARQSSPSEALKLWASTVSGPLLRTLAGEESFTQLSNGIYESLERLTS